MVLLILSSVIFVLVVIVAIMALHARNLSATIDDLNEEIDERRQLNQSQHQLTMDLVAQLIAEHETEVADFRQQLRNAYVSLSAVLDQTQDTEQGDTPCSEEQSSSSEEPQSSQADSPSEPSTEPCSESESVRTSLDPRATSAKKQKSKKPQPPEETETSEESPPPEVPSQT